MTLPDETHPDRINNTWRLVIPRNALNPALPHKQRFRTPLSFSKPVLSRLAADFTFNDIQLVEVMQGLFGCRRWRAYMYVMDFRLAIKWQVFEVFCRQHAGQQTGAWGR